MSTVEVTGTIVHITHRNISKVAHTKKWMLHFDVEVDPSVPSNTVDLPAQVRFVCKESRLKEIAPNETFEIGDRVYFNGDGTPSQSVLLNRAGKL